MALNRYRQRILVFLFASLCLLTGCSMPIQHGLTESQANKVIVLFSKSGIPATKLKNAEGREVTWTIVVSNSDAVKGIQLLQRYNLPPKKVSGLTETYSQTGMIPTATQERARFLMAQSGELVKTFKHINGVLDARVHLVMPEDKILRSPGQKEPEPRASILLNVQSGRFTNGRIKQAWFKQLRLDSQYIVMGAIKKITPANIKVVVREMGSPGSASAISNEPDASGNAQTTAVLSMQVDIKHAMRLKLILGGMILLLVIFISLFVWFFTRAASLKNQLKALNTNAFN